MCPHRLMHPMLLVLMFDLNRCVAHRLEDSGTCTAIHLA